MYIYTKMLMFNFWMCTPLSMFVYIEQVGMCGQTSICRRVSQRGVGGTGTMIRTALSLCSDQRRLA